MRRILIVFISLSIGACAFSPQTVEITPNHYQASSEPGKGKNISLKVDDERPDESLGVRGAQGMGAQIKSGANTEKNIEDAIKKGLEAQGFSVVDNSENKLDVEIRAIDYQVITGFWSGTLKIDAAIKGTCKHNNQEIYDDIYRSNFERSMQVIQPAHKNQVNINNTVSKALHAMLSDPRLMECLAQ